MVANFIMATVLGLCVLLAFVVYSQCSKDVGVFENKPGCDHVYPTPSHDQCPMWFVSNGSECMCHSVPGVICGSGKVQLRLGFCMYNASSGLILVARCPFSYMLNATDYINNAFVSLPDKKNEINQFFCGHLRRKSILCSKCQVGLGQPVLSHSLKCMPCMSHPYGWLMYTLLAVFPTTVLYFLVILFDVRAASPKLNFVVFMTQYMSFIASAFPLASIPLYVKIVLTFYNIWNLEYFRYFIPAFCVSEKLSLVHVLTLEYLVAFYPLLLIVVTYACIELHARGNKVVVCLWRPFRVCFLQIRQRWNPRGSIIDAFATFLVLSYSKLLVVSYNLLDSAQLYSNHGNMLGKARIFLDASVMLSSPEHLPFVLLASFVLCVFIALPLLFLFLYPLRAFQRCLHVCHFRWHTLHAFAEVFNGHYKDGTKGTQDCRWFGGLYFCLRIVLICGTPVVTWQYQWLVVTIACTATQFLLLYFQPYKDSMFNRLDGFFLGVFTIGVAVDMYRNFISDVPLWFYSTICCLPLMYFAFLALCKIFVQTQLFEICSLQCPKFGAVVVLLAGGQHHVTLEDDDGVPHRLLNPGQYRPYGTIGL